MAWVTGYASVTCAQITGGLGYFPASTPTSRSKRLENLPREFELLLSHRPFLHMFSALEDALEMAGWSGLNPEDAFLFATTTGQVPLWETDLMTHFMGQMTDEALFHTFRFEPLGTTLLALSRALSFQGRSHLFTTACAASTQAIGLAASLIRQGKVKRCLVGASEALSKLTVEGFRSFQLISSDLAAPFDSNRSGINLSEGAAFLCLEAEPKISPKARISGAGFASDAFHMTAPHPEGRGALAAMQMALHSAGLTPKDIAWVHAHGTGSPHNDLAEGTALHTLFGGHTPPVSSTKALHGHPLAAAGAIETVLCIKALQEKKIIPTHNLRVPDPRIPIRHATGNEPIEKGHILKSTLGFGGSNAALVISSGEIS
jgi:3-oxoacyl-(acyl-carrier-protein) synthase